ncbi:MAG: hypothetical protein ACWGPN_17100 [Gammaproteobacteria bacterium]
MKPKLMRFLRLVVLAAVSSLLVSCEAPQVYGSVGYSSYGGGYYGSGLRTSVSIGGRIY